MLIPKCVLRASETLFEPKQFKPETNANNFTAQEAGIFANADLSNFCIRVLLLKPSDNTLKLLRKTTSFDFLITSEKHQNDFYSLPNSNTFNPCDVSRVGLHNHLSNIYPHFAPEWFADAFIAFFYFHCYILSQFGFHFSTFLFLQNVITFLLKFCMSITIKFRLQENTYLLSSIAIGEKNKTPSKLVLALDNVEVEKPQRKCLQRLEDPKEHLYKIESC